MLTNGLYGIGMSRWLLMLVSSAKAQMRQLGPHLLKSLHVPSPCLKSIPPPRPHLMVQTDFKKSCLSCVSWGGCLPLRLCVWALDNVTSLLRGHTPETPSPSWLPPASSKHTPQSGRCGHVIDSNWRWRRFLGWAVLFGAGMIKPHIFYSFDQNTDSYSLNGVWFAPHYIKPESLKQNLFRWMWPDVCRWTAVGVSTHNVRNRGTFRAQCELNCPI